MLFSAIPSVLVPVVAVAALAFAGAAVPPWPATVASVAAFAAVAIVGAGLVILRHGGGAVHLSRAFAELMALTWGWGGLSMVLAYGAAGLKWQHGWQYGSAMLLIAVGLTLYSRRIVTGSPLAEPASMEWGRKAAFLQGFAAGTGISWLIGSGKLATVKGDWAANDVFLAGGVAILCLSAMAIVGCGSGCPATSKAPKG